MELVPADQRTTVLSFPDLVARLEKRHRSIAANPRYQRNAAKLSLQYLNRLHFLQKRNVIRVELEIPKQLVRHLHSNRIFRKGGVLRKSGSGEIVKHLKEVKPSKVRKLAKVANVAFVVVDILESALLDEKLKEILEAVKTIESKLDAQNKGKLNGALSAMQELALIEDPETRRQRTSLIQNSLKEAEWIFREEYENRWKKYAASKSSFESARLTNTSDLTRMQEQANGLVADLEPIVLCQVAHTQLYVELHEYVVAEKGGQELTAFVADNVARFKEAFGDASIRRKEPKHKTIFNFRRQQKFANFEDTVIEPNERIENLLNQTIVYSLSIAEEIVSATSDISDGTKTLLNERSLTIWDRLTMLWLRFIYKIKAALRLQR